MIAAGQLGVETAAFWHLTMWEFETMIAARVAQVPPLRPPAELAQHLMALAARGKRT